MSIPFLSPRTAAATGRTPLRFPCNAGIAYLTLAAVDENGVSKGPLKMIMTPFPSTMSAMPSFTPSSSSFSSCEPANYYPSFPSSSSSSSSIYTMMPSVLISSQKEHRIGSRQRAQKPGIPTVGSDPTSCVTPAVSPIVVSRLFLKTHDEDAFSLYWQVEQANISWWVWRSSFG